MTFPPSAHTPAAMALTALYAQCRNRPGESRQTKNPLPGHNVQVRLTLVSDTVILAISRQGKKITDVDEIRIKHDFGIPSGCSRTPSQPAGPGKNVYYEVEYRWVQPLMGGA